MRIKRVEIKNYKSLKHIVLEDVRQLNVIVGKNNSGKSNILEVVVFPKAQSLEDVSSIFVHSKDAHSETFFLVGLSELFSARLPASL